jgi:tRNA-modifying protein YgfZ
MSKPPIFCPLPARGLVVIEGPDRVSFLQGLITQDAARASGDTAAFAALLTPQGKVIADFFILERGEALWLETGAPERVAARLKPYLLRAKASVRIDGDMAVGAIIGAATPGPLAGGVAFADPRRADLGSRWIGPSTAMAEAAAALGATVADTATYDAHRLALGVPDAEADIALEQDFALEGLYDELGAVDFHKGCYVGQEMTSRMKRRGTVRSKLARITFEGAAPPRGTAVTADGVRIGEVRSGMDGAALALVRLDRALEAGGNFDMDGRPARLNAQPWLILPQGEN